MHAPRLRRHRSILLILGFGLLLLALRLIWGEIANRRLNEQLAAARPWPLSSAELYSPRADDDPENAVPLLMQALTAMNTSVVSPAQSNLEYPDAPPYSAEWHRMADAAVAANANSLALLRQARGKTRVFWPISPTSNNGSFANARNLANLTGDAALRAHVRGDDVEALELCRDVLFLSRAMDAQRNSIAHLVGNGIGALALNRIAVIAPGLKLTRNDNDPARQSVQSLVKEVRDESSQIEGLRNALVRDRVEHIDAMNVAFDHTWATRPMYQLDLARLLEADGSMIAAASQPTLAAIRAVMKDVAHDPHLPTTRSSAKPPRFSHELSSTWGSSTAQILQVDLRLRLERRMTALSLAAQLYRADHDTWPQSLGELAPAYLESLPADVYRRDGRPITYLMLKQPDGQPRPMLLSIGPDGMIDSPTDFSNAPDVPQYGWHYKRGQDDQFRDLSRWLSPNR